MQQTTNETNEPIIASTVPTEERAPIINRSYNATASLYCGDLELDVTEGLLYEIFKRVGVVTSIRVCRDDVTKRSLRYAYINFADPKDAQRALDTLNHTVIKGTPCRLMWQQRDPAKRRSGKGNIYISNLASTIGNKELGDTFSQFGSISSCKVVLDEDGVSKGFGYVHYVNPESAQTAVKMVNGKQIEGQTVHVSMFKSRRERQEQREKSWTNVFIKNLPADATEDSVNEIFSPFGSVTSTFINVKTLPNRPAKAYGFVNFANHEDAVAAVEEMNGKAIGEEAIYCGRAMKKSERDAMLKRQEQIRRREQVNMYYGRNLFIKNLDEIIDDQRLREEFEEFGTITSCLVMKHDNGQSRGFGFVCFSTKEEAQAALEEYGRHRVTLPGCTKPLYVRLHEPKEMRRQRYLSKQNRNKGLRMQTYQGVFYPNHVPQMMYQQPPRGRWNNPQYSQGMPNGYPMMGVLPQGGVPTSPSTMQPSPQQKRPATTPQPGFTAPQQPQMSDEEYQYLLNVQADDKRVMLGEKLYPRIATYEPEYASKITGMVLEWTNKDILDLLNNEQRMAETVQAAMGVLAKAEQQP